MMKPCVYILFLGLSLTQCRPKEDNSIPQIERIFAIPATIKTEHEYLLNEIEKLAAFEDSTGMTAVKLKDLMQHHFKEEENYVLPPLSHLPLLAEGKIPSQSDEVIGLTEKFKAQLIHMQTEHQLIKAYMDEVLQAAAKENHPEAISLEKEISKHAATEEEIFFPAAILIGEYLKLKSNQK